MPKKSLPLKEAVGRVSNNNKSGSSGSKTSLFGTGPVKHPAPQSPLARQPSVNQRRKATSQRQKGLMSRIFCGCCGTKTDATKVNESNKGGPIDDGTDQSGEEGKHGEAADEKKNTPQHVVNINITNGHGTEVKITRTPGEDPDSDPPPQTPVGAIYTYQDPVRSVRISLADIPRMQSRMAS
jgi:hypothetical protein